MAHVHHMLEKYHPDLKDVRVGALMAYDPDDPKTGVLVHQGYPASAMVRIISPKDRAAGMPDAQIIIDLADWLLLSSAERDALIDHELTHLVRVEKDGIGLFDIQGRPKLKMRKHSRQFGWFDEVAERHGEASPEVRQARQLLQSGAEQLYFPGFEPAKEAA